MAHDIDALRREYTIHGLSESLYWVIRRAVAVTIWRLGVPHWRAPEGHWDSDNISSVADEFIVEVLTRERLLALLDVAESTSELIRDLERLVSDFLRRTAIRGPVANVREQIIRILESSPEFFPLSQEGKRRQWVWGLSRWGNRPPSDGDRGRAREAIHILFRADRPRYSPQSKKRAPAVRSADLHRFLEGLLTLTQTPWVMGDIVELVVETLGLRDVDVPLSIEEATARGLEPWREDRDGTELTEVRNRARLFYSGCSPQERMILRVLANDARGYEELAARTSVSKATAWRRSQGMAKRLAHQIGDTNLALQVWDEVMVIARTERFLEEGLHE